jgi:hypothetical protein
MSSYQGFTKGFTTSTSRLRGLKWIQDLPKPYQNPINTPLRRELKKKGRKKEKKLESTYKKLKCNGLGA